MKVSERYIPVVRFVSGKRQCCECGGWFDPEYQGDKDDKRCVECIDKENAKEV